MTEELRDLQAHHSRRSSFRVIARNAITCLLLPPMAKFDSNLKTVVDAFSANVNVVLNALRHELDSAKALFEDIQALHDYVRMYQ